MTPHYVLALSGASGIAYGLRLFHVLRSEGVQLTVAVTTGGARVAEIEEGVRLDPEALDLERLAEAARREGEEPASLDGVRAARLSDIAAAVCSGTHPVDGMFVAPCSMGTLARIVHGTSANVVERSADVMLKERRPLVLLPRESPLSRIHLANLLAAHDAGATIVPCSPGFYHGPECIDDLVDQVVTKALDVAGLPAELIRRWKTPSVPTRRDEVGG